MHDNLAVFFLAQDEQPAAGVMKRLTNFIGRARETLDFALYDLRLTGPLKSSLIAALRERAAAGVRIRFCYDGDKPREPKPCRRPGPGAARDGCIHRVARLSLAADRGDEVDARQIHRARSRGGLDRLDQSDGRRLQHHGEQRRRNRFRRARRPFIWRISSSSLRRETSRTPETSRPRRCR